MTVRELIEQLQDFSPTAEVVLHPVSDTVALPEFSIENIDAFEHGKKVSIEGVEIT